MGTKPTKRKNGLKTDFGDRIMKKYDKSMDKIKYIQWMKSYHTQIDE